VRFKEPLLLSLHALHSLSLLLDQLLLVRRT
jgi:hypothetical protein